MNILGINAYHGNASAAILCDGILVAAVEEERFNRVKYAAGFPAAAIRYCLQAAGITLAEVDHVAVPRNPYARLVTKLFYALRMTSFARERVKVLAKFTGIKEALAAAFDLAPEKLHAQFHRVEHHVAHIASAFYCSPFEEAALLSADGLGDFASSMWGAGFGRRMNIHGSIAFPHSLGLYYSAVTQYLGFLKFGDEYKVMGLGAYGEAEFLPEFRDAADTRTGSRAGSAHRAAAQKSRLLAAGALGGSVSWDVAAAGGRNGYEVGVLGGRCGVQLRSQRKDSAIDRFRECICASGGG